MSETEFLDLAETTLNTIESAMDRLNDEDLLDVECKRSGNVLEIEFIDNGSKIIVNSQAPMQELWVAAKSGGFHYKRVGADWINTRDGSELFAALSQAPVLGEIVFALAPGRGRKARTVTQSVSVVSAHVPPGDPASTPLTTGCMIGSTPMPMSSSMIRWQPARSGPSPRGRARGSARR